MWQHQDFENFRRNKSSLLLPSSQLRTDLPIGKALFFISCLLQSRRIRQKEREESLDSNEKVVWGSGLHHMNYNYLFPNWGVLQFRDLRKATLVRHSSWHKINMQRMFLE